MRNLIRTVMVTVIAGACFLAGGMAVAAPDATPIQGTEAKAATDRNETGYWLTSSSNKRHYKTCRYYKNSIGRFCGSNDGIPCMICGGGPSQSEGATSGTSRDQSTYNSTDRTTGPGDRETGQTTATGKTIYEGPRGGHYHYSASGKKVYEKRRK